MTVAQATARTSLDPSPPYARTTVKIHKNPVKTRLLVCSRDTVFYSTAQHLTIVLSPLGKSTNPFISDSTDFCTKIRDINNPGPISVVALWIYSPMYLVKKLSGHYATEFNKTIFNNHSTPASLPTIISLTSACINSTHFTWGDAIYEQVHGLPMGSPLSPILTEIYMTDLEDRALETAPFEPSCWYRKVDDNFVVLQSHSASRPSQRTTTFPRCPCIPHLL
ncbi:uncharacterized protein [Haliotis asinina]|uniref:uncharacterized protein n=1 Tax=Haliotis asinina TaxID=109174 RepID=UPI003531AAA2